MQNKELKLNRVSLERQIKEFEKNVSISQETLNQNKNIYLESKKERKFKIEPLFEIGKIKIKYEDSFGIEAEVRNVKEHAIKSVT